MLFAFTGDGERITLTSCMGVPMTSPGYLVLQLERNVPFVIIKLLQHHIVSFNLEKRTLNFNRVSEPLDVS